MRRRRWNSGAAGLLALALATGVLGCGSSVPAPTAAPTAATSHFSSPGIAFDYPSTWKATQLNVEFHYEATLGLLGTGEFAEACPSDAQPGQMNTCVEQFTLAPDTVIVKASRWWLLTPRGMSEVQFQAFADPSAVPMTISGQRGVRSRLGEPMSGADEHWLWLVDAPGDPSTAYAIEAWLRGPDLDVPRAQLDAVVASMTVTTPPQ
jgi:hypothetical protein